VSDSGASVLERAVDTAKVTRFVAVERGALLQLPRIVAALEHGRTLRIVADPATMYAAGDAVLAVLQSAGFVLEDPIVLTEAPRAKPQAETARSLAQQLAATDAIALAVGAGVINDVTKYAAEVAGVPYGAVATAASMDGYAASGAAMLEDGFKRTLACRPPIAIVADLDVIARAPSRMAAWGYGDLAGKLVAGADWLLADAAGEDALDAAPFALVQTHVKGWLSKPAAIAAHDTDALRGLVEGLLISGFAMQAHGNSRPASGSEHQLSHLWEMDGVARDGEPAAHGACVGVGTVAMIALYEWLLGQDMSARADHLFEFGARPVARNVERASSAGANGRIARPDDGSAIEAELRASFAAPFLVDSARIEMTAKVARAGRREARVRALATAWPALCGQIEATLVPAKTIEDWLGLAQASFHPAHLGISSAKLARDYRRARLIRRRYTILDCLDDLGWLDEAIGALFASDGFWGRRSLESPIAASAAE